MKLLFKQRVFAWFDTYDIYDEEGNTVYTVKGQLSWGHRLVIYDKNGMDVGLVEQRIFCLLPTFDIYVNGEYKGFIRKEFTFLTHHYNIDYNGWHIDGDFFGWEYEVVDKNGSCVASIGKELFNFGDTYVIDVKSPEYALDALMFVLAVDAEKCSND